MWRTTMHLLNKWNSLRMIFYTCKQTKIESNLRMMSMATAVPQNEEKKANKRKTIATFFWIRLGIYTYICIIAQNLFHISWCNSILYENWNKCEKISKCFWWLNYENWSKTCKSLKYVRMKCLSNILFSVQWRFCCNTTNIREDIHTYYTDWREFLLNFTVPYVKKHGKNENVRKI